MKRQFRLRKPLFSPLNYGDDDLERINRLNGHGQDTVAVRSDFLRATFALDYWQVT
jgi:hypothetical protein